MKLINFSSRLRHVLVFLFFSISLSANATCILKIVATDALWAVLNKHEFNFDNYDLTCKKINDANARVMISGGFVNINGIKVASITVHLVDRDTMLISNGYHQLNINVDSRANGRSKDSMISLSINRALSEWTNLDDAIKDLSTQRKLIKNSV